MLLDKRQNIEPPKNTKNGHRVAAIISGGPISMSSGDSCFKSMSFGVSITELCEAFPPGLNGKDQVNKLRKSET